MLDTCLAHLCLTIEVMSMTNETELVGGLEHVFPYVGNNHPSCLIFFERG